MKHFITGARYRHSNCLDIDIEIERVRFVGPNYTIVNIAYFNRNWQDGEFLVCREKNVKINTNVVNLWSRIK